MAKAIDIVLLMASTIIVDCLQHMWLQSWGTRYGNVGSKDKPKKGTLKSTEGKTGERDGVEEKINPGKRCSKGHRETNARGWDGCSIMKTGLRHERILLAFNNDLCLGMTKVAGWWPPVSRIKKAWMGKTSDWLKISDFFNILPEKVGYLVHTCILGRLPEIFLWLQHNSW